MAATRIGLSDIFGAENGLERVPVVEMSPKSSIAEQLSVRLESVEVIQLDGLAAFIPLPFQDANAES